MKIGFWSYPTLFQSSGGLQNQIVETANALNDLGCEIVQMRALDHDLNQFDAVHMFSAAHGNHTVARHIANHGVPLVVSPLLQAYWSKSFGRASKMASWLIGKSSGWRMRTEYDHYQRCLSLADQVIALGEREKRALNECFNVPHSSCHVIPNGIADRFFESNAGMFLARYRLQPGYILSVGLIGKWKNQALVVKAAEELGREAVLIGPCKKEDQPYLHELTKFGHVRYIGALPYESELLCSAYAGAGAFCLPSVSEVMPMTALEALASGTHAVITKNNSMDIRCEGLHLVDPMSFTDVVTSLDFCYRSNLTKTTISAEVGHLKWRKVAEALIQVYGGRGNHDQN